MVIRLPPPKLPEAGAREDAVRSEVKVESLSDSPSSGGPSGAGSATEADPETGQPYSSAKASHSPAWRCSSSTAARVRSTTTGDAPVCSSSRARRAKRFSARRSEPG